MKKILIVQEGQWGDLKPGDYQDFIDTLVRVLSKAEREFDSYLGKKGEKEAVIEVVATSAEAEVEIHQQGIDVVIFISRSMETVAERLAKTFPKTRMIVITGLIPAGKVVWVNKISASSGEFLRKIVFSS